VSVPSYVLQHVICHSDLEATVGTEGLAGRAFEVVLEVHERLLPLQLQRVVVSELVLDLELKVRQLGRSVVRRLERLHGLLEVALLACHVTNRVEARRTRATSSAHTHTHAHTPVSTRGTPSRLAGPHIRIRGNLLLEHLVGFAALHQQQQPQ